MKRTEQYAHGGQIHKLARQMGIEPSDFTDFSSSINPLGPPAGVLRALSNAKKIVGPYPDSANYDLKRALATRENLAADYFLAGNGSTELIFLIPRVFRPKTTLVVGPTFGEYERAARLAGSHIVHASLDINGSWQLPQYEARKIGGADLCFICNPNNPSGTILAKETIRNLAQAFGQTLFVVDEAFVDFLPRPAYVSVADLCDSHRNIIVLRSFTKFYATAGLRLGYAIAHPERIRMLESNKEPWSVNALAQAAGQCVLEDNLFEIRTRQWLPAARSHVAAELKKTRVFSPVESQANFLLIKSLAKDISAGLLFRRLLAKRIVLRDASNFYGLDNSYFRVAIKSGAENEMLLAALSETLVLPTCP